MTAGTSSAPAGPKLGPIGWLRWAWRQLTSMRTALLLLLLVAVAAVPGSVFPQRSIDQKAVSDFVESNPGAAPWLDRLGLFDVYSSAWFSAIYLLLVVSLLGCILPRSSRHATALRGAPPRVPSRLGRLPAHLSFEVDGTPQSVEEQARAALRRARYRLRGKETDGEVAGECGYLRETGNLLFHVGVVVVIVALAWGYLVGWRADRIVPVGQSFTNTVGGYDTFTSGPWVERDSLEPFAVRLDNLDVRFEESSGGAQFGAARDFRALTTVTRPGQEPRQQGLSVNGPLTFGNASVYLLGNGYAPRIVVRDGAGRVVYRESPAFLPQDGVYTSTGAIKVTGAPGKQLGFTGVFLPTAVRGPQGPESAFPDLRNPALVLTGYEGQLFGGGPQSVYQLDTSRMTQLTDAGGAPLKLTLLPGESATLPGGRGTITFEGVDRWAGVSTRYDPAKPLALASSLVALAGLVGSLLIKRRRVFVRAVALPESGRGPRCRVEVAALARGEDPLLADAVSRLARRLGAPDGAATEEAPPPAVVPAPDPAVEGDWDDRAR